MYAQGGILNEMKNTKKISIMSGLVTIGVLLCGLPHAMAESVPQNLHKHNTKLNKFRRATMVVSSACMILASFGVTNIQAKDSISPITDLRFASELTHKKSKTKAPKETKVDETSNELIITSVSYNEDKTVATLSIKSTNSDYTISLSDDSLELYKELFEDGTLNKTDVSPNEISISTNDRSIYTFTILVKDTSNNLIKTETISFKALNVFDTNVSTASDDVENSADVSYRAGSTVQTSHDSQSMTVKYTSPGSYTWSIPSEVDLNNQQSMTVSATKVNDEANASLKISVSSENDFKMKSSTGRTGAYKITKDGNQIVNNSIVLETTSSGTTTADLKFTANPTNFITSGTYNDTLTFKAQNGYATGTVLEIEGMKFIVMSQTDDDTYLVINGASIGTMQYQPNVDSEGNYLIGQEENNPNEKRSDGKYSNTYEGSYIDNYLENNWYSQLPEKLRKAIKATDIKQTAYTGFKTNTKWKCFDPNGGNYVTWHYNEGTSDNPKWVPFNKASIPDDETGLLPYVYLSRSTTGYADTVYNTITRHAFLPSIDELLNLVNLNNANKTYSFLKGTNDILGHLWLRDSDKTSPYKALNLNYDYRSIGGYGVTVCWNSVRPAFVIDLSKVDATVVDTVKYK